MKKLKSIDITIAFCDEAWGQKAAQVQLPIGGTPEQIVEALQALIAPLYSNVAVQWEVEQIAEQAKMLPPVGPAAMEEEVPF